MICEPEALICLTDPPWVVELKKEYRALDERVEQLKPRTATDCEPMAQAELERATARKREIFQQLFHQGYRFE